MIKLQRGAWPVVDTKRITGLSRGLRVLKSLNESNGATVLGISRATNLPRATVYRILATLMDEGYVTRSGLRDAFWLSMDVHSLSSGYSDRAWVAEVATPILAELGREVVWPVDIATLDGDSMLIRQTTYQTSPLAIDRDYGARRGYPGYRVPLLQTSLGHAYLAFCPKPERDAILESLFNSETEISDNMTDRHTIHKTLNYTRRLGYGSREGGFVPSTGSIAVPVKHDERVMACINLHYMLSVMSLEEAVSRYLGPLHSAAQSITE
ncbi:MAG: helix-turn-helix domain-containing protein, partial [Proteobacteria bacterium]|nr:helix-turn-helix domain-containing protein [Pseudomonadota bacterium]